MKLENVIAERAHKKVYRDGDYCIKLFDEEFSKSNILNEALNQARVEETGLNIPKIKEVTTIDGKWAIISDYIEGKTIDKLIKEDPANKEQYLQKFVDIQTEIHTKRCPLLTKLRDKMDRKISLTELDATTRYDLHARLESMPRHNKLCHGDFNPSNVIIAENGEHYIIDWSHATQGNATADAARTYLTFLLAGDEESAEKYVELFCKKIDVPKQFVFKWMPIVAASQSVKGYEEEYDLLMSWVTGPNYWRES